MAIVNKPDMNYGTWAENGNIEIPSSEKVEEGWVIEKPLNEHMNWVQNRQDKMLQYLNQRGMAEWDFRTEYPKDAYVVRAGLLYQALIQNTDKDPTTNTNIWKQPFALSGVADGAGGEIEKIKNQEGYLSLYVSKKNPVMTGEAKGIAYLESTGKSGLKFTGGLPQIFSSGKVVAEFSGGSQPNDVVTHQQLGTRLQGYQVGDIYITTAAGDPKTRLGYGTWERFAQGEVLVGFSTSVSNSVPQWVKTVGSKFGSYDHKLLTDELPSHNHSMNIKQYRHGKHGRAASEAFWADGDSSDTSPRLPSNYKTIIDNTGGDQPHNNVQPSIVVFMWKRTA